MTNKTKTYTRPKKVQRPRRKNLEAKYVSYLQNEFEIDALKQKYQRAYEWIPRLSVERPNMTSEEALLKISSRLDELKKINDKLKNSGLLEKIEKRKFDRGSLEWVSDD